MCLGVAEERAGKRCKWLIVKPLEPSGNGLKIRVSVVRFRPWPPLTFLFSYDLQSGCAVEIGCLCRICAVTLRADKSCSPRQQSHTKRLNLNQAFLAL